MSYRRRTELSKRKLIHRNVKDIIGIIVKNISRFDPGKASGLSSIGYKIVFILEEYKKCLIVMKFTLEMKSDILDISSNEIKKILIYLFSLR